MDNWPPENIDLHDRARWLTMAEAAHVANVEERTLRRWIAAGKKIAVRTPGGKLYFDRERLIEPA